MWELITKYQEQILGLTNPFLYVVFADLGIINLYLAEKKLFHHTFELITYLVLSPFFSYGIADYFLNEEGICNIIVLSYLTGQLTPKLLDEAKKVVLSRIRKFK